MATADPMIVSQPAAASSHVGSTAAASSSSSSIGGGGAIATDACRSTGWLAIDGADIEPPPMAPAVATAMGRGAAEVRPAQARAGRRFGLGDGDGGI